MKTTLLFLASFLIILLTLVSCSVMPERSPSSDICSDSIRSFFQKNNVELISAHIQDLIEKNILTPTDLDFLKDERIAKFLSKQKTERGEIEADILLIKKKFQHMDSSQVIGHFKLLRNSCERS